MNPRIIELAKKCFTDECYDPISKIYSDIPRNVNELEAFYTEAHQDGQRAMRERAADKLLKIGALGDGDFLEAIRNLEIE